MLQNTDSCRFNAMSKAAHEACDCLITGRLLDLKGPDYSLTIGCGLRVVILSDPFDVAAKLLAVGSCPNPIDFSQNKSAALSLTVEKKHMGLVRALPDSPDIDLTQETGLVLLRRFIGVIIRRGRNETHIGIYITIRHLTFNKSMFRLWFTSLIQV